jgi:hypothetical protein
VGSLCSDDRQSESVRVQSLIGARRQTRRPPVRRIRSIYLSKAEKL